MPGEFRDVDVPGGAIKDSISFLPYKEPSQVLYTLLGNIVDEGRRFAAQADMKVSEMSNQAPVGTTLAIMERHEGYVCGAGTGSCVFKGRVQDTGKPYQEVYASRILL